MRSLGALPATVALIGISFPKSLVYLVDLVIFLTLCDFHLFSGSGKP